MTVPAQTPINRHTGNGVTTIFPFTFKVLQADDLEVSIGGVVQSSGFTVSGVGANSGDVTFTVPPSAGAVVVLRRVMAIQRTTDYQDQGAMPAATVDDDHDATVMMVQQVAAVQSSALQYPVLEGISGTLPAAADRAGKLLAFNGDGLPVMSAPASGSAADLAIDLATTGTGKGAQMVAFSWAAIPSAIQLADWGIQTAANGVNVLRYIPPAQWSAIAGRTSTYDVTDDVLPALLAGGDVYFPAGLFNIRAGALAATDKKLSIRGAGIGATTIKVTGTGVGIDLTTTAVEAGVYSISDIGFDTETVGTCTAIRVTDTKTGVNGGYDVLHLRNVLIDSSNNGYWRVGFHAKNCGGIYGSGLTIRNNNDQDAQADPNTKGIYLENLQAGTQVIRQLFLNTFYVQRCYRAVHVETNNSIESFNISQGELVGTQTGVYTSGSGIVASGYITGTHVDALEDCIDFESQASVWRISDNDFRKLSNGGSSVSGSVVKINGGGESMTLTGNIFSGENHLTPALSHIGVNIASNYDRIVIADNTFRNLDSGIEAPTATEYSFGPNQFEQVTSPYGTLNNDAGSFKGLAETVDSVEGQYAGDLNNLAGAITGLTVRRVSTGATNIPGGTTAGGSHVETLVWNADAAKQVFYAAGASGGVYYRRKSAGSWGAWQQFTLV